MRALIKLLGYLWSAPHTLIGILLALYYRSHTWRWSEGAIECTAGERSDRGDASKLPTTRIIGKPGAQTHGCLIVYRNTRKRKNKELRRHERVHVKQGMIGGPFYVVAYVLFFFTIWAWQRDGWKRAYRSNPFEKHAYGDYNEPEDDSWEKIKAGFLALPPATEEQREEQRRDFAYGNLKIDRPEVTREMIDKAAEELDK